MPDHYAAEAQQIQSRTHEILGRGGAGSPSQSLRRAVEEGNRDPSTHVAGLCVLLHGDLEVLDKVIAAMYQRLAPVINRARLDGPENVGGGPAATTMPTRSEVGESLYEARARLVVARMRLERMIEAVEV